MNVIDKLGATMIRFFSKFTKVNKRKETNLFLYKRGLTLFKFNDRVFIKMDTHGKKFIDEILKQEFEKYTVKKESAVDKFFGDKNKPGNEYILEVWYNDLFRFEFVSISYWKHLCFAATLADKYDLPIGLDSMFVHCIEEIDTFNGPERGLDEK